MKSENKRLIKSNFVKIAFGIFSIVSIMATLTQTVYGAATGEGGFGGGHGYQTGGTGKWWDTCHGASWVKYPVNGNNSISIPARGSVQGGTLKGCVDDGADYYYRLGLQVFDRSTGNPVAEQAGLVPASKISSYWPIGELNSVWGGNAIDVGTAAAYFAKTQEHNMNNGLNWPNVSAFCWSSKLEKCPPTDPYYPTCTPPPSVSEASGSAHFYATSTISIPYDQDGIVKMEGDNALQSEAEDKNVRLTISTDQDSVAIQFWHTLYYVTTDVKPEDYPLLDENGNNTGQINWDAYHDASYKQDDDYFDDNVTTSFTISKGSSTASAPNVGSGSGTASRSKDYEPKSDGSSKVGDTGIVHISMQPNQKKTICQRISYSNKNFKYKAEVDEKDGEQIGTNPDGTPMYRHLKWKWTIDNSDGSGNSEACVVIYRPADSDGVTFNPGTAGDVDASPMYAGEETVFRWNTLGETAPTRRLYDWEGVAWLTTESAGQHTVGNNRFWGVNSRPCVYYGGNTYYCNHDAGGPKQYYNNTHTWTKNDTYVVPDHTASKFCLSFGYFYQFWYGKSTNYPTTPLSYTHKSDKDYWRIYNASCRTIAKKPSAAVWNGSLMTMGGIKTSLSPRYNTQAMNDNGVGGNDELIPTSSGGDRTLYGSWSEHLDVIGKLDVGHGSGSTLYKGSEQKLTLFPDNVNLTISNADSEGEAKLGFSQIQKNSAYHTKLNTFLRDNVNFTETTSPVRRYKLSTSAEVMNKVNSNMTDTTIIVYNGSEPLKIDKNIVYHNPVNGYGNIYDLPQVLIFSNKDIQITDDVTRIDAWLITDGTLDTCSNKSSIYMGEQTDSNHYDAAATVYGIGGVQTCSKQLVFNGPVIAHGLKLNRTFGADPLASIGKNYQATFETNSTDDSTKEAPAEIFNLRADTYLWAYAQAGRYDSSYTESYSRELPPRY